MLQKELNKQLQTITKLQWKVTIKITVFGDMTA
jgi:hypothetical protein